MQRLISLLVVLSSLGWLNSARAIYFSDDFNRPNGEVGNGWMNWGDFQPDDTAAEIFGQHLTAQSGGVYRTCPLQPGIPLSFEFDFAPKDSNAQVGWVIQINTTNPSLVNVDAADRMLLFLQGISNGVADNIRYKIGANLYDSGASSINSRSYTSWAHISGQVAGDLSATITVDYGDGGPLAIFAWASPGIDPIVVSQGSKVALGAARQDGPKGAYFDNFVLTPEPATCLLLVMAGILFLRRK